MGLAFKIAWRFLTTSKGQTFLIILGIAIGISVQIFIGSLIQGLQISLVDATIGSASQLTVLSADKNGTVNNYDKVADIISENEEITVVSPEVTKAGFIRYGNNTEPLVFKGIEYSQGDEIYKFDEALTEGEKPEENQIIIGTVLAEENGIEVGDTVEIITPEGSVNEAEVSGIFDLKVTAVNESWVVGELVFAQEIFGLESKQVTEIASQVTEPFEADALAMEIIESLDDDSLEVSNWKNENQQLLSGLSGQTTSSLMIQIFVIISVVLGISSVLAITVIQKSRQIGILKAMGLKDGSASQIFIFQGVVLGLFGGLLGIVLGVGLLWAFSTFALNPDGTAVVPIYLDPAFIGISGLIAVAASTIASMIPAVRSRKLSPIEVIRNG
jgi:lipoprotein-releasing system permease protein